MAPLAPENTHRLVEDILQSPPVDVSAPYDIRDNGEAVEYVEEEECGGGGGGGGGVDDVPGRRGGYAHRQSGGGGGGGQAVWECYAHDYDSVEAFVWRYTRLLNTVERIRGWTGWVRDIVYILFYRNNPAKRAKHAKRQR
ncbi:hypothetical protein MAPG_02157 [Magnaporthiopsis poae ATCC 64411]|uniref:Uncharacterized protein n=1 Tax=Magnaporthiopsis poae (strain ATCC 64411 / 73-15) TaxID=644358 RepID=A0A0C4DQL3_MAGP6|nr:hypothetical protein MAPG_02157 [Magnaporthiopsis poae ATCC 64411]